MKMELKSILTEEELGKMPEGVVAKIESAMASEVTSAVEAERKKSTKKIGQLIESVGAKADEKISKAIEESVSRIKGNAMNDRMYKILKDVAALIESAGIPTSEATKRLKEELAQCNFNLKQAYAEREKVKQELNDQQKKNFIYKEVQGMKPEIVDAVMQHFINFDIREITSQAISDFLRGNATAYMMDVDPDTDSELNLDKVEAALSEMDRDLEMDIPSFPSRNRKSSTVYNKGGAKIEPMKTGVYTPDVSYESLDNMEMPMLEGAEQMDGVAPEVKEAMAAMESFSSLDSFR
jgi:hypothetical protein